MLPGYNWHKRQTEYISFSILNTQNPIRHETYRKFSNRSRVDLRKSPSFTDIDRSPSASKLTSVFSVTRKQSKLKTDKICDQARRRFHQISRCQNIWFDLRGNDPDAREVHYHRAGRTKSDTKYVSPKDKQVYENSLKSFDKYIIELQNVERLTHPRIHSR